MTVRVIRAAALAAVPVCLFATAVTAGPVRVTRLHPSQPELVYASMALSQTTGITNVYQVAGSGATLVATLSRGGGGPVAVDSKQNVYVVQANYDSSGFVENSRIFIYAHGATKPHRTLYAPGIEATSMTVAPDGTVYIAGQDWPNTSAFSIVRFPPGSQTEQVLPADPRNPIYPTGISLDAAGNLFAGWLSGGNRCSVVDLHGCVTDLPAGQNAWQLRLAAPSAANDIAGGPIVTSNGSLILLTTGFNFTYLETVRPDRKLPSQVISLSVIPCCAGGNVLLLDAAGDRVWAMQTFLGSSSTVYGIDYPGGEVSSSFAVSAPGSQPYILSGMAVSPAYYPGMRR